MTQLWGIQIFCEIPYLHWTILYTIDQHMVFNVSAGAGPSPLFEEPVCHEEDRGGSGREHPFFLL